MAKLLPDKKRCEVEWRERRFFALGGTHGPLVRCTNVPAWIAKEKDPGPDGFRRGMSVCAEHLKACKAQFGNSITLTRIKKKGRTNARAR